jgi:hypothetical protein
LIWAVPPMRHALGREGEAAVLDEAVGVDQVGEVLARGSGPQGMAFGDRLGPRLVTGEPATLERLGEVIAHVAKTFIGWERWDS